MEKLNQMDKKLDTVVKNQKIMIAMQEDLINNQYTMMNILKYTMK